MAKEQGKNRGFWKRFSWIGVLLFGILSKLKSILPLLKFGKFGGTIITMGVSILAYAYRFTWAFAIGLVLMIFIHEMGHVIAAKRKKLPVSAPAFIPFVGALITMKKMPQDAATEAYIAYGGPLLGTIGAVLCFLLGLFTNMDVLIVIAFIGFLLNLFNLIPIHPLDGGRIVVAISRWIWIIGVILALGLILLTKSILLIVIFGLFVFEMWASRSERSSKPREVTHRFHIPTTKFIETQVVIPGEKHQRELPFRHHCRVDNREELLDISYPGVGELGKLKLDGLQGVIEKVELVQTTSKNDGELMMFVKIRYIPDTTRKDRYYEVTPATRLKYACAYVGLIAFLTVMTLFAFLEIDQLSL